jgi:lipoate-protein ligase A
VTAEGRKLVGSAQWRDGAALLQHGSILLVNDQHVTEELRVQSATTAPVSGAAHTGAIALDDLLKETPPVDELVASLATGFESEFDVPVEIGTLDDQETQLAHERVGHYKDPTWTWRR